MQVAAYKQNDKEDFQTTLTCITNFAREGQREGEMSKKEFLQYLEVLEGGEASMGRQVLSDVVKGYFLVLIESGRSPLKVMKSSLRCNKIAQFLIQGKSQSKWHMKYWGLGVAVIKLSSKFKNLSI